MNNFLNDNFNSFTELEGHFLEFLKFLDHSAGWSWTEVADKVINWCYSYGEFYQKDFFWTDKENVEHSLCDYPQKWVNRFIKKCYNLLNAEGDLIDEVHCALDSDH